MKSLGSFFEKFKNKAAGDVQNRLFIIETVKKITNIDLDMSDLTISSGILRIRSSQLLRNEIFIKKDQIISEINRKIKALVISDIK